MNNIKNRLEPLMSVKLLFNPDYFIALSLLLNNCLLSLQREKCSLLQLS